jgi:hypothetical protein
MTNVEYQTKMLIKEIKKSNEYNQFQRLRRKLGKEPELKKRVDLYREQRFALQNNQDEDGTALEKLEKEQGGGIITRQRVEHIVISCTTLKRAFEIGEIVDNVLLELLMTAAEFDRVGRERLMSRFESFCKDDFNKAPGRLAKEYGIEIEQGFDDYWGLIKQRRGRVEKPTFKEEREAAKALEAFRRWSKDNNPGGDSNDI